MLSSVLICLWEWIMIYYFSCGMFESSKEGFLFARSDNFNNLNNLFNYLSSLIFLDNNWLNFIKVHRFCTFRLFLLILDYFILSRIILVWNRTWLTWLGFFRSSWCYFILRSWRAILLFRNCLLRLISISYRTFRR